MKAKHIQCIICDSLPSMGHMVQYVPARKKYWLFGPLIPAHVRLTCIYCNFSWKVEVKL